MNEISSDDPKAGGRRRGRRGGSRRNRGSGGGEDTPRAIAQPPFRQPFNPYPPTPGVSEDELEAIHQASLEILEDIGIDFIHEEAKAMLKAAGADVDADGDRVRMDRAMVEEALYKAPETFTFHARNPERNMQFGGNALIYCAIASAPNCADLDGGRRVGNQEDFRRFLKLGHMLNAVHIWGGYPVEPTDVHASVRHLDCLYDMLTMSDKGIHAYSLGKERNRDALEMIRIARGISDEQLEREPSLMTIINASSPLRHDTTMLQGIIEMASRNQVVILTPFTLAGAMAPVTIAGAVAQQNAEALAGLVFTQLVKPGAPFVYGGFTSNVDMKSGAPAFGTPEYMKATLLGGQLARRYKLPYRSSNVNAANSVDAQAAYESVFSLWSVAQGGANLIKHAAGWMEGGLQASFEKMVLDADLLNMMSEFFNPVVVNDDELALDAMREVGPGGHFFGCAHTQARYKTAFFDPMISDWRNYESWREAGAPQAHNKANAIYKQLVAEYQAPPIDPAIEEELAAFVAKRKEEGGAPTDF